MPLLAPIRPVIENDLCIACGACVAACPENVVVPAFNTVRGAPEVAIENPDACLDCPAPCGPVCPSIQVDFAALLAEPAPARDGRIQEVLVGYAPDHRDNGIASSGGVLRLLAAQAVAAGTPVLCLGPVAEQGGRTAFDARVITDLQALAEIPGSIYHAVSFAAAIPLLRTLERPCLLIAIPCHLEGLLAYITGHEPALRERIDLIAGIICGWMYSHHALDAFASYKQLAEPWQDARYRGDDKVGRLKVFARSGVHSWDRRNFSGLGEMLDYRASFSTDANRLRCRVCEDHLNVLADLAVGDAWLARMGDRKLSVIAVRSTRGASAIAGERAAGRLLVEPGTIADLVESQSRDLMYGETAGRLAAWLRRRGRPAPQFGYQPPAMQPAEGGSFAVEMLRRGVLRRGWYRSYRWLYALSRPALILRFLRRGSTTP